MITIDLHQFRGKGVRVFSGRDRGRFIREYCGVTPETPVTIIIPDDTFSITRTFWMEMLRDLTTITFVGPAIHVEGANDALQTLANFPTRCVFGLDPE
jgi:hypothetical protein